MDEVKTKRESVLVTKNGKPVAKLVPLDLAEGEHLLDAFRFPGGVETHGDIMAPMYSDEKWEEFLKYSAEQLS